MQNLSVELKGPPQNRPEKHFEFHSTGRVENSIGIGSLSVIRSDSRADTRPCNRPDIRSSSPFGSRQGSTPDNHDGNLDEQQLTTCSHLNQNTKNHTKPTSSNKE